MHCELRKSDIIYYVDHIAEYIAGFTGGKARNKLKHACTFARNMIHTCTSQVKLLNWSVIPECITHLED